jgi:hypothetical protein
MELEKSYLGFTDKKIPMQRAKTEAALDRSVRFEGTVWRKIYPKAYLSANGRTRLYRCVLPYFTTRK